MVTELRLLVLGLLARRPRSAYAVGKALAELPTSSFTGSPGAIYPALHAMERDGLVVKHQGGGGRGQPYRPSEIGQVTLQRWLNDPIDPWELIRSPGTVALRLSFLEDDRDRARFHRLVRGAAESLLSHVGDYRDRSEAYLAESPAEAFDLVEQLLRAYVLWSDAAGGEEGAV